tara:strand:- start:93 stop:446 length:354 start_codon:yes stop_codon:yes gene_type:complete
MKKLAIVLGMFLGIMNATSQEVFEFKGMYKGLKITLSENTIEYNYKGAITMFDVELAGKEGYTDTYNVINSNELSTTKHRFRFVRADKYASVVWETRDDFTGKTTQQLFPIKKITQL